MSAVNVLRSIETWLFETCCISKKLTVMQEKVGLPRVQVLLAVWVLLTAVIFTSPGYVVACYTLLLAYPIYNSFKKLFSTANDLRPLLTFWIFFGVFCILDCLFFHYKPFLLIGQHFFILMYCPATNWQESLFFGLMAPVYEVLVEGTFKKETWNAVNPLFAKLLLWFRPERICILRNRCNEEQVKAIEECCKASVERFEKEAAGSPEATSHTKREKSQTQTEASSIRPPTSTKSKVTSKSTSKANQ